VQLCSRRDVVPLMLPSSEQPLGGRASFASSVKLLNGSGAASLALSGAGTEAFLISSAALGGARAGAPSVLVVFVCCAASSAAKSSMSTPTPMP